MPKRSWLPPAPEPPAPPVGEQSPVPTHTVSTTRPGEAVEARSPRPKKESLMEGLLIMAKSGIDLWTCEDASEVLDA